MMRFPFETSFRNLIRPGVAFAAPPPPLHRALRDMALAWVPLALANAMGTAWRSIQAYDALRRGGRPSGVIQWLGLDPAGLQEVWSGLPAAPAFGRVWPWLLLLVPLSVMGTWLHHAVWDHAGLWLVGGLKEKRGFRASLVAEAEALRTAAVGTLVGLLGFVPVLGAVLMLPLVLLDGYLWLFRGFALAARHGCEPWRGVAATVVHALLLACCASGLLTLMLLLIRMAA